MSISRGDVCILDKPLECVLHSFVTNDGKIAAQKTPPDGEVRRLTFSLGGYFCLISANSQRRGQVQDPRHPLLCPLGAVKC